MFQVTPLDDNKDYFHTSKRPLNVANINRESFLMPLSTRIPVQEFIRHSKSQFAENTLGFQIKTEFDDSVNEESLYCEHFCRDFVPISIPNMKCTPKLPPNRYQTRKPYPHWNCDIPSSNMRLQPKIDMKSACNPELSFPLPLCTICSEQLSYPFYSSLSSNLCYNCISSGNIPYYESTLDFTRVDKPTYNDGNWSLSDTNKLLSLIEENGDDWQEVSKQMKNKTPTECLLHFLRLPICDQYYNSNPFAVSQQPSPDIKDYLPFMNTEQPISTFVEFIHLFHHKLGLEVAENSKQIIETLLKSSTSSNIPFNQIQQIMRQIIDRSQESAAQIAIEEWNSTIELMKELARRFENEVGSMFNGLNNEIRSIDSRLSSNPAHENE